MWIKQLRLTASRLRVTQPQLEGVMTNLRVRQAESIDAASIARIYNYYVQNTVVTFEEEAVSTGVMARRMAEVGAVPLPWLVAELDNAVVGYAYASRWKVRSAYRHSVETTVYLEHGLEDVASARSCIPNS